LTLSELIKIHLAFHHTIEIINYIPEVFLAHSFRTRAQSFSILNFLVDRNRTVSRRSKPNSRTTLNGEQPYPWLLLRTQDVMSRHRGAKPRYQFEFSSRISLLPLAYLLSGKQPPFHTERLDHYNRQNPCSTCLSHSQAYLYY